MRLCVTPCVWFSVLCSILKIVRKTESNELNSDASINFLGRDTFYGRSRNDFGLIRCLISNERTCEVKLPASTSAVRVSRLMTKGVKLFVSAPAVRSI